MIPNNSLFHKPANVIAAKKIINADIFLIFITFTILAVRQGLKQYSISEKILFAIAIIIASFIVGAEISQERKWARTLFLVLFVIEMLFTPFLLTHIFQLNYVLVLLYLLQVALQFFSLKFLFSRESSSWFNGTSLQESAESGGKPY